ncbi:LysR substrate-binding domain-containing protein [Lutimaribacter sp. EGI FJ00015]|uniref:LysR substrate-binding domain-containing protein n=1 Tax=Lutimaribacter degradans TaxID=2945989 RepID=A0ACC5ZSL7_9RHOB|nr:LysR substrate-binding domain-containing protein [Lutimaribacter sp. EGI FJ00013]MCM2561087.1 LysR substrate-binding domain-containing protein [Lutimaribacter sp. EGI FJ00013]MCO0611964.1 LysR substrate-binding domain-containing protein [Lutimaribacter sp. EGI FJ00015]MCO0634915.1 LysR substrate-binding domain-containing protein [Lutimaribacter sp. EGI FJ00014]
MLAPRRYLPSVSALRALESLDRLGSATAAAAELNLTQSAVSRQLQALEEQLGVPLVRRSGRRMQLTPAASEYVGKVRSALQQIAEAGLHLHTTPTGVGTVSLAILPTFGMRWLVPRLPEFTRRHPEVTVNLSTCLTAVNFDNERYDAAIFFGPTPPPACHALRLRTESVIAVCAPSLLDEQELQAAQDILSLPLLHIQTRPDAWGEWLARHGVTARGQSGMVYDQFNTITQAALHGLGVALLPDYLAEQDLATGRLVAAWGNAVESAGAYHLIWPRARPASAALIAFRDWMATQAEDGDSLPR